jgi:acetyl esterase/lipase
LSLPDAAQAQRILYTSTSGVDGTTPTVVSGDMFVPKGSPPAGGWPVIAWAHGTVGVADICAPSWAARSYRDSAYLDTWLAQGYAVVATDYEGLGTPGGHPYLNVRSEAYSVLDAVRAGRAADSTLANDVVIVGQSQGGGAAFGTAGWAPVYAADVNVRGTVATGVPYFAPNVPSAGASDPTAVDPGIAYIFYLVVMAQQSDPSIDPASVFQAAALPLFEVSRTSCIYSMEQDVELARLTDATSLKPALTALLAKHYPEFEYRTLALPQPVFIGTGTADHDVRPAVQERLVKDSCAAGTLVQAHRYAGLTHSETVNASLKDSLPFVRAVFAGEKPVPNCSPTPE